MEQSLMFGDFFYFLNFFVFEIGKKHLIICTFNISKS